MSLVHTIREEQITIAPGVSLELIEVVGGKYTIGTDKEQHQGNLDTFWLGKYPVTNVQYLAFVEATGQHEPEWREKDSDYNIYTGNDRRYLALGNALTADNHPVVGISWDNAVAFTNWLSQQSGHHYTLPSETQWEYAARGGVHADDFPYAGSHRLTEVGWFSRNSHGSTKAVGLKLPNSLGLYDMSGNVREWCADAWHASYVGAPQDGSARLGDGKTTGRVVRGGSWDDFDNFCQVSYRYYNLLLDRYSVIGFRLARYQPPLAAT